MNGWWIDARMDGWLDEWINGGIDKYIVMLKSM